MATMNGNGTLEHRDLSGHDRVKASLILENGLFEY